MNARFISLFGGIGGFDLALEREGWKCQDYVECWKPAVQAYNKNFSTCFEPKKIQDIEAFPHVELITAGFPCQDLSRGGKKQGLKGTRSSLFWEAYRAIRSSKPKNFLIENADELTKINRGRDFLTVLNSLQELGYSIEWQVLNSAAFGIPQQRRRTFIIGHLGEFPGQRVFPFAQVVGGVLEQINSSHEEVSQAYRCYRSSGVSPTINTTYPQLIERGGKVTYLTATELERLQGFPDGWTSGFSYAQRRKMLGNAVNVAVAQAIAARLQK